MLERVLSVLVFVLLSFQLISQLQYDIKDFGAVGDGITMNTTFIQSAIDKASLNGGGQVVVPDGRFLTGSISLKSNVDLHLMEGATLLGSTNPEEYLVLNGWKAVVIAEGQINVGISGSGEIDGQGRKLALTIDSLFYAGKVDSSDYNFVEMRPKYYLRPQLIEFVECENIIIKNIVLRNAACWVQTYDRCSNLVIDSIHVDSDAYWNNDGIDIIDCHNVSLTDSYFNSADDGICFKSHSAEHFSDSIYVANCTVRSSASAIKFGTVSRGGFKNFEIRNINIYDTFRSAIAIESVDGGFLENILIDGVEAKNTGNAIFIRLANRWGKERKGNLKNITLRNVKVEVAFQRPDYQYEIRGPELPFFHNVFPSSITGIPGSQVENVLLENIEIAYPGRGNKGLAYAPLDRLDDIPEKVSEYPEFSMFGELPAWGFYIRHVKGVEMRNVKMSIAEADYRPAIVLDDVKDLHLSNLSIDGDQKLDQVLLHNVQNTDIDSLIRTKVLE